MAALILMLVAGAAGFFGGRRYERWDLTQRAAEKLAGLDVRESA